MAVADAVGEAVRSVVAVGRRVRDGLAAPRDHSGAVGRVGGAGHDQGILVLVRVVCQHVHRHRAVLVSGGSVVVGNRVVVGVTPRVRDGREGAHVVDVREILHVVAGQEVRALRGSDGGRPVEFTVGVRRERVRPHEDAIPVVDLVHLGRVRVEAVTGRRARCDRRLPVVVGLTGNRAGADHRTAGAVLGVGRVLHRRLDGRLLRAGLTRRDRGGRRVGLWLGQVAAGIGRSRADGEEEQTEQQADCRRRDASSAMPCGPAV